MDRRLTIGIAFAVVATCSPALLGQTTGLPSHHRSMLTIDRVTSAPILNRFTQTPSPELEFVRLPACYPTTDQRRLESAAISNHRYTGRPHQLMHRRYPSTDRVVTAEVVRDATVAITYQWDSNDANLLAAASRTEKQIEVGFKLANKGALYGARAEFRKATFAIAEALDARYGTTGHTQAFHDALQAMKEAGDFASDKMRGTGRVERIVASHQTPVLRQLPVKGMPALIATQRYYSYAYQRLLACAGRAPVASNAMYAMGKLHMAMVDAENHDDQNTAKAMTFLQAALTMNRSNFAAANELGVMLARLGHLRDAREVLRHSAKVRPTQQTWKNLETVHQRLGEFQLAEQARGEFNLQRQISSAPPAIAGSTVKVQWVSPEVFAGNPSGGIPQTVPPSITAEKPAGFSLWPWR